jgi:hypothetical protein
MSFDVAHKIQGAKIPQGRTLAMVVDYPLSTCPVFFAQARRYFGPLISPFGGREKAGVCLFQNPANWVHIKPFFERDGDEANVFQWQPLEQNFVARSLDWFLVPGRVLS